jgi:ATP-dependent 26S proteasome regulatory subunit
LYLRKDDKYRLKKALEIFASKKELMENLGIQHKLGVLLYGLPGTGKTSSIQAVASYLKKNLYYVNLNDTFYRDGRFDVKIEMKMRDHYQINELYKNFFKHNIPKNLLSRISENHYTSATIITHKELFI